MTNAELIAKIKAEIERLKGIGGIVPLDNREQKTGYESALIDIEIFLSTLESEKPMQEGLEKEITTWIPTHISGGENGIQWRHDHFHGKRDGHLSGEYLERTSQLDLARHFAKWGAKHFRDSTKMVETPKDLERKEDEQ